METMITDQRSQDLELLSGTRALTGVILDALTDADLAYKLPGNTLTLGEICVEMGLVEESYLDSFRTFRQSWAFGEPPAGAASSIDVLRDWYARLDAEMDATLTAMSAEDYTSKMIDRSFPVPPQMQVQIYIQALLIFYGKASIYLRALQKPLTEQFRLWIG